MTLVAFNRYWVIRWPWVLVNLVAVSILVSLSLWQLSRATEKMQTLARIANWQQQGAVGASQLSHIDADKIDGLQLDFHARWLSPMVWLLDNQMVNGRVGYDVIVAVEEVLSTDPLSSDSLNSDQLRSEPVVSTPSAKKQTAVLVNLGWVEAPAGRDVLPTISIADELRIQGIFRTKTKGLLLGTNLENKGKGVWPMRIQQMDAESLAPYVQQPLHPGFIYQQKDSPFGIHYRPVVLPPERHRAYALQWGLLAVAVIVIALAASARKVIVHE
jgi:surfeit locus 1 family protein